MCILIPKQTEMFASSAEKGQMKKCLGNFLWMRAVVLQCTSIAWYEIIMTHNNVVRIKLCQEILYNPRIFEFLNILKALTMKRKLEKKGTEKTAQ